MKIAVVGSGISGLSAAYYLSKKYHVDLFEREDHFGGHSHTIDLFFDEKKVSVDSGICPTERRRVLRNEGSDLGILVWLGEKSLGMVAWG